MKLLPQIGLWAIFATVVSCNIGLRPLVAESLYLEFSVYRELTALFHELGGPRLLNLTPAAQELWSAGQIRVPAQGVYVEGDFTGQRQICSALLIRSEGRPYALLAEHAGEGSRRRLGLLEMGFEPTTLEWNGRALKVSGQSFITWDGESFSVEQGSRAFYDYELKPKYKRVVEEWQWSWPSDVNLAAYMSGLGAERSVVVARGEGGRMTDLEVKVLFGSETEYRWNGNANSAFVLVGDRLYHTDFQQLSTGMSLVAFDLREQKELWRTRLYGLGPISHSKYRNWGAHLRVSGDVLEVLGRESAGGYVEFIYRPSGQTFANRTFPQM